MNERASQARQRRVAGPPGKRGAFRGLQQNAERFRGVRERSREEAM
jgi:hypothetical protein